MQHRRKHRPFADLRAPVALRRRLTLERTAIRFVGLGALAFIATAVLLLDPQSQRPRLASTKVDSSVEASATACKPLKLELVACPSVTPATSGGQPTQQASSERISSDPGSSEETHAAGTQVASVAQPSEQTAPERGSSDIGSPEETRTAEVQVTPADQPSEQTSPERVSSDPDSSGETRAAEVQFASVDQPGQQTSPEPVSSDPGSPGETRATEAQVPAPVVLAHNDIVVPVALKAVKESQAANSQLTTGKLAHASKSKSPVPRRRRLVRDYPSLRIGASTPMLDLARYSY